MLRQHALQTTPLHAIVKPQIRLGSAFAARPPSPAFPSPANNFCEVSQAIRSPTFANCPAPQSTSHAVSRNVFIRLPRYSLFFGRALLCFWFCVRGRAMRNIGCPAMGLPEGGHGGDDLGERASVEWKGFLANRDWESVLKYYKHAIENAEFARSSDFALAGVGSGGANWFGLLDPAREAVKGGIGRERRSTFLVEIDYLGSGFQGVQANHGIRTVMGCIYQGEEAPKSVAMAGRTDAGVHAIGQVLSFSTWAPASEDDIASALAAVAPGEIRIVRVRKVHRSFHANFGATWRRYLYLFPLNTVGGGPDVDCERVRRQLQGVEGEPLHFNALAFANIRNWGVREDVDVCTLQTTAARRVELPGDPPSAALLVELVADRFLRRMVRILVSTAIRAAVRGEEDLELRRIVLGGKREGAALPAPSEGLCMVGVGYDTYDTSRGGAAIRASRQATQDAAPDAPPPVPRAPEPQVEQDGKE